MWYPTFDLYISRRSRTSPLCCKRSCERTFDPNIIDFGRFQFDCTSQLYCDNTRVVSLQKRSLSKYFECYNQSSFKRKTGRNKNSIRIGTLLQRKRWFNMVASEEKKLRRRYVAFRGWQSRSHFFWLEFKKLAEWGQHDFHNKIHLWFVHLYLHLIGPIKDKNQSII